MMFLRQVSRALDDEHRTNLELLGRVEQGFARRGAARDPEVANLAATLGSHLAQDIERHFAFEERELFPRMSDAGDGDMAALLCEEHEAIRAVAAELAPLIAAAIAGTLDDRGWDALRRCALELCEREVAHIQKETMALLPLLDDLLSESDDAALSFEYASH